MHCIISIIYGKKVVVSLDKNFKVLLIAKKWIDKSCVVLTFFQNGAPVPWGVSRSHSWQHKTFMAIHSSLKAKLQFHNRKCNVFDETFHRDAYFFFLEGFISITNGKNIFWHLDCLNYHWICHTRWNRSHRYCKRLQLYIKGYGFISRSKEFMISWKFVWDIEKQHILCHHFECVLLSKSAAVSWILINAIIVHMEA